jgi:hypothetical protein
LAKGARLLGRRALGLGFPTFVSERGLCGVAKSRLAIVSSLFSSSEFSFFSGDLSPMVDSAYLKINRAAKHVTELSELFRKECPFSYILETNAMTGERATFAKKNEAVISCAAITCGDVIHNLRSALDHAYWEIVSPFAATEAERKKVQFPFSKTLAGLNETVKDRLADRVSPRFFKAFIDLKPYPEPGGNELLYLIESLDILDKHKLLIPTGDYTRLSGEIIRRQVPDFPINIGVNEFGNNKRDVGWSVPPGGIDQRQIGAIRSPTTHIFEKKLDVPVDIVLSVGTPGLHRPIIPTLNALVDVAKETIKILREESYSP